MKLRAAELHRRSSDAYCTQSAEYSVCLAVPIAALVDILRRVGPVKIRGNPEVSLVNTYKALPSPEQGHRTLSIKDQVSIQFRDRERERERDLDTRRLLNKS
jgi:hypothetical protein